MTIFTQKNVNLLQFSDSIFISSYYQLFEKNAIQKYSKYGTKSKQKTSETVQFRIFFFLICKQNSVDLVSWSAT